MDAIEWIIENKTWLFSGAGAVIIGAILNWILRKPNHSQRQDVGAGSHNIQAQAGRDLTITFDASSPTRQMKEAPEHTDNILVSMPQLMSEMRSDLLPPEAKFTREFYVLPNRKFNPWSDQKPRFAYYEDEHQNLRGQIDILEEHGFLTNVTPVGNNPPPTYRMTENLVNCLCNETNDKQLNKSPIEASLLGKKGSP